MQKALYKKVKVTRGYWRDIMTVKEMKRFAKREVRRKSKVK